MLADKLLSGGVEKQYIDDLFSSFCYTGNGSTQTITNGIDLAGKGGLVWIKERTTAQNHNLWDSERGLGAYLKSNTTDTTSALSGMSFTPTGMSITATGSVWNASGLSYVSWTFRKAPKFFDVVTYTGNGANRTISHSLGQEVGMLLVKRTDTAADWQVYHRSLANTEYAVLNSIAAKATGATRWNSTTPTSSVFSVGTDTTVNASGGTYVAYLFAHDTAADGIIQCGSFNISGGARTTVSLGWEPQYLLMKSSTGAEVWEVLDNTRGLTTDSAAAMLQPNSSAAESPAGTSMGARLTATGFTAQNSNGTYIYLAIRRPNKPPTVGTQVYNAIARTGTGAAATVTGVGFAPDLVMPFNRSGVAGAGHPVYDRLRGALKSLRANLTNTENTDTASLTAFGVDGITVGADGGEYINSSRESSIINHFFKRAPGVFDVVCYTGTGVAKTEAHNLGVVPELMIVKARSSAGFSWATYSAAVGNTKTLYVDTTGAAVTVAMWNNTTPTSTVFSIGAVGSSNFNGTTYVCYLFATKAGISKVFSFTGNGTNQNIECGFTTGARFVLLKRTDSTGDWLVADTVRGLVSGNDPSLALNSTAAEVTTLDWIDPYIGGFNIVQEGTNNANVNTATYIGLALS